MAKVRLLHGKPLMVGGKVALSDDCCCGPTPPTVCPTSVTFSGIEFCCVPGGSGTSAMLFEDSGADPIEVINDTPFSLLDIDPAAPCDTRCSGQTDLGIHNWNSSDCTTSPTGDTVTGIALFVVHAAGIWYVLALTAADGVILFYGTTTNPATPIANQVICNNTVEYDNDAFTCLFDGPSMLLGVAENGTATLNF